MLALDSPVAVVLITAPSLRSDSVVPTFEKLSKGAAPARPKTLGPGEEHMTVLLSYFLIAAVLGVTASALIGYFLANLIDRRFMKN